MDGKLKKAFLPKETADLLRETCRRRLPFETCGIVFGSRSADAVAVDGFAVVRNAASRPERAFVFDPDDWIRTYYEARRQDRDIIGYFHSHPGGPPTPSVKDGETKLLRGTCWIIGFAEGNGRIAVYRREDGSHGPEWIPLALSVV